MHVITSDDATAVSDEFFEVILADPDLFEVAFDAVVASWQADPPRFPPVTAAGSTTPGPPPAPPRESHPDAGDATGNPQASVEPPRVARSPPPRRGRSGSD